MKGTALYNCLNVGMLGHEVAPEQAVELAAKHGFRGVDLPIPAVKDAAALRALMDGRGVRGGSAGGLLPGKTDADDATWDAAVKALPALAKRAADLGFTRTTVVVLPFHEKLDPQTNRRTHIARLQQVGPILGEHGIRLGLEYVSQETRRAGQPNHFANNLAQLLPIIREAGQRNVGLLLDAFHWYCAGESLDDVRRLTNAEVVVVHVNDSIKGRPMHEQIAFERQLPMATGEIDLPGFIQALSAIGYDGPVTAEPFDPALKRQSVDEAVAATSEAMGRMFRAAGVNGG